MTSVAHADSEAGVNRGTDVSAPARDFGERHDRVELANRARSFQNRRAVRLQIAKQLREELKLEFLERRFRGQDFALQLLERGGGEALGADQGLLALVVGGNAREIRLGDLDVVP